MAEIRFNYGDKFTQTSDSNTGIGSTIPAAKLDVAGETSAGSLRVTGIATLSSVSGFVNTKLTTSTQDMIVEAGNSGSVSGEVVVSTGQTISVSTGATTGQGGIQSLKVYETFMPPVGGTADRPTDVKPGMVYYNKDFKTIEFWDGNFWKQVDNTTRRGRAVWAGGYDSGGTPAVHISSIDFINVPTLGNSNNFGDLSAAGQDAHGCGSETRGIYMGEFNSDAIEYITIASEGDSIDFGDIGTSRNYGASGSSSTRGLHFGGDTPSTTNSIEYIQINTHGDSLDFGDLTVARRCYGGALSNGRTISVGGGDSPSSSYVSTYDQVTISSLGNATQFGELINNYNYSPSGNSNQVRGVLAGGQNDSDAEPYYSKQIQYITLSSGGNAQYFGDLSTFALTSGAGVTETRAVFALGHVRVPSSNDVNTLEFVTIATTGNSQDFGDLRGGDNQAHSRVISPVSDSHGGLGGF